MNIEDWGGMAFNWNREDGPGERGMTVWNVFEDDSSYFAPRVARWTPRPRSPGMGSSVGSWILRVIAWNYGNHRRG